MVDIFERYTLAGFKMPTSNMFNEIELAVTGTVPMVDTIQLSAPQLFPTFSINHFTTT